LPYEDVWFPAEDGVRLHGWLIPGAADKPLVLFFHGNAANISHRVENLQFLHALGFPVFIFDYRGFGQSEGTPLHESDLHRDGRGALSFLQQRGWTQARLIYFGRSLGGAVAVQMALEEPPAGLILEATFTSLAGIARHAMPIAYHLFGWWSIGNGFDTLAKIDRLNIPLLVIHGQQDEVVPPDMSHHLFVRAPEPKSLLLVDGAGHSDCFLAGGAAYRQTWLKFAATSQWAVLSRALPARATPPP